MKQHTLIRSVDYLYRCIKATIWTNRGYNVVYVVMAEGNTYLYQKVSDFKRSFGIILLGIQHSITKNFLDGIVELDNPPKETKLFGIYKLKS